MKDTRRTGRDSGQAEHRGEQYGHPSGDRMDDMRKANENVRKSQGDDSAIGRTGNKPRVDRDR